MESAVKILKESFNIFFHKKSGLEWEGKSSCNYYIVYLKYKL